jgi:hypothetical protein
MSTILQGPPESNEVSSLASAAFVDQLASASGFTGPVTYTQTTGGTHLTIASDGAVSTTGALGLGSYTATGTTADTHGNTGTFTYTLTVVVFNSLGFSSYSIVGTPSGGQLAEVTFNSNAPDVFGSYYFLDGDVIGWDSPDMRMTMLTKIGSDVNAEGEIPADLHYRGRSLQFTLFVECISETARENSKQLLAQACNTSDGTFTVNEAVPKFLSVLRAGNTAQGKLTMTDQGRQSKMSATQPTTGGFWGVPPGTDIFPFKAVVELYAPDPFKYGVDPVVGTFAFNTMTFDNPGTYPTMKAVIDLTATGGTDGPLDLITTERTLVLQVPALPAGAPALSPIPEHLVLDLYNQLIYDGGFGPGANCYYLRDMRTPWLRIPTGSGQTLSIGSGVGGPGTLTFYPAWL